ncbi:dTDP-4-dehydrorhamnose 3,5-epimerase [Candidatus Cerribacteria bacterium 'Amazon FNV 2010 28 9']|uniref:dTDP-4-dehydrorhamnose 3,5-epimerase n=1 Tax=Candidatus Cerribacteria bacterium 'Amazon FNV 2010 28 9' TaxID=2081795 RepID=A0A317JQG2_9BACT|nr:MAG: dTDP-4-dehydrorhamnose 3,5-epimerase [Candidatus Cerribacteria bacterium 'Amazon FNV 2010 28 9']
MIKAISTAIPDCVELFPDIFPDSRGEFLESYNKQNLALVGITDDFIQDSVSVSKQYVLRGLHFQKAPFAQTKLVSVLEGEVFDVAVDLRKGSATYGKWISVVLTANTHNMLYIPAGFAHGFLALSEKVTFLYKIAGGYYNKENASGILWNDPTLNITWPLKGALPILSKQDKNLPLFIS